MGQNELELMASALRLKVMIDDHGKASTDRGIARRRPCCAWTRGKRGDSVMKIERWHRRQAVMLASQLPEGPGDALAVLECVRELVTTFLQSDTAEPAKATIITLVRDCQDLSA
jgi:hypothetical protein